MARSKHNTPRIEFYRACDTRWYWRVRAGNGRVVALGVGQRSRRDVLKQIAAMINAAYVAGEPVEVAR